MKIQSAFNVAITTVCIGLAMLACDSPVAQDPGPRNDGEFFFGDEATAEVKRLLENAVHTQEALKGPQGAYLAASQGLTLDAAISAAAESISYYTEVLETFSGKALIAQLEDGLRTARETLEVLKGPQGARHAAGVGMTLTTAIADTESKIEIYGSVLARRQAPQSGQVGDVAASANSCSQPAQLIRPDLELDGPYYDGSQNKTIAIATASQGVGYRARQEIEVEMAITIEDSEAEEGRTVFKRKRTSTGNSCVYGISDARIVWTKGGDASVCVIAESRHTAETDDNPPDDSDHRMEIDFNCDGDYLDDGNDGAAH